MHRATSECGTSRTEKLKMCGGEASQEHQLPEVSAAFAADHIHCHGLAKRYACVQPCPLVPANGCALFIEESSPDNTPVSLHVQWAQIQQRLRTRHARHLFCSTMMIACMSEEMSRDWTR